MKGNSNCHIFSEQGRDNYDAIFGKKEIKKLGASGKKGAKAGAKLKRTFTRVDSSIPPITKRKGIK